MRTGRHRHRDDRSSPRQRYGILETGPATTHNALLDNDVRDGGTEAELEVYAENTIGDGNITN